MKRKKSILKNIVAWVVVLCLLMNTLPSEFTFSLLEAVSAKGFDFDSDALSKVEIKDGSLQETIYKISSSASENDPGQGKITLDKDYSENLIIPDNTVVVIDLCGHTLSPVYSGEENHIAVYGTLKIIDSAGGGMLSSDGSSDIRAITVVSGAKLVIDGVEIKNYHSSGNGAGIRVEDNGYFNMISTKLTGNSSELQGGAVYAFNANCVDFSSGEISGNSALNGGGIAFYRSDSISENSVYTLTNLAVTGNNATENGGGIYVESPIFVSIENLTVDNNIAQKNGGGFFFNSTASLTVDAESSISGNTAAENYGGGVYFYASTVLKGSSFTLNGGKVNNNTSKNNGGGIYFAAADASTKPQFVLNSGEINGNSAGSSGGGVYMYRKSDFTMNGGSVANNSAQNNGGGIFVEGGLNGANASSFTMNGGVVSDNTLTADTNTRYGAGVRVGGYTNINLNKGEITRNTKAFYGGGLYGDSYCVINVCDGMIISENSIYSGNGQTIGAGLYFGQYVTFVMTGGKIDSNYCETESCVGGGLYIAGNTREITISGGEITNNKIYGSGAGLYVSGAVTINGTARIAGNEALGRYSNSGTYGGGVYISGTLELGGDAIIENNVSNFRGGGVYCSGSVEIRDEAVVQNNTALYNSGGGLYIGPGNNTGAVQNVTLKMKGGKVINNTANYTGNAYSYGGGIFIRTNKNIYLTGGVISGNTAAYGGGVSIVRNVGGTAGVTYYGPAAEVSTNMEISGNTAMLSGGGVFVDSATRLELYNGGKIINNIAENYGGGVFVQHDSRRDFLNAQSGSGTEDEALEILGGELHDNTSNLGRDFYVDETFTGTNVPAYLSVTKASSMENASESAYWRDETNGGISYDDLSNKTKVDNGETPKYSAYTFNNVTEAVASIGDETFLSVQSAIDAIKKEQVSGNDIVLLKSNIESVTVPEGITASLDLNGNVLYGSVGSVITIQKDAKLTVKDTVGGGIITKGKGTVHSNNQTYGGGVYILSGTFVMESGTISGNKAQWGTAVYVNNGTFEMTGGTIENNRYSSTNSAICADGTSQLTISNAVITNNDARAIYINGGSITAEIKDSTLSKCGLAVHVQSCNTVTIENCNIIENKTSNNDWGAVRVNSGTVYIIKDTVIKNNTSPYGAGLFISGGCFVHLDGVKITENIATSAPTDGTGGPGGVRVYNAQFYMKNSKVYNNRSVSYGSDMYIGARAYFHNETGETTDWRTAESFGLDDYNSWLDESTGKYYVSDKSEHDASIADFENVSDMVLTNHQAPIAYFLTAKKAPDGNDGDDYVAEFEDNNQKFVTLGAAISAAEKRGDEVTTIKLLKDISENNVVRSSDTKITIDLCGHTITSVVGKTNIFSINGGDLTLKDSAGGGKLVPADKTENDISMTRAIYIGRNGKFTLEGGEISGFDYNGDGAAIYCAPGTCEININGGTIKDNAASGSGGAIYILANVTNSANVFNMTGGNISGNTAVSNGGGIYMNVNNASSNTSKLTISGGVIEDNHAGNQGGGIWCYGNNNANNKSEFAVYGCEIKNNSAYTGGAIHASNTGFNSPFILGDESKTTIISGNSSTYIVGGAYIYNTSADAKGVVICNVEFKENTATSSCGAMYVYSCNVSIKNCAVHDNLSRNTCAGIDISSGKFTVEDCKFYRNVAQNSGGGLYIENPPTSFYSGESCIKNCKMYENCANNGSGVYDTSLDDVTYEGCEFYKNFTQGSISGGPAMCFSGRATARTKTILNCRIHDNTTNSGSGGGIVTTGAGNVTIRLENTEVKNNYASASGGGICFSRYEKHTLILDSGTTISGNKCGGSGGGVFVSSDLVINEGAVIENNTATASGGGVYFSDQTYALDFTMKGGEIRNNESLGVGNNDGGGGVCIYNQSFTSVANVEFSGGKISGNSGKYGGGLSIYNYNFDRVVPMVRISGTEISDNIATYNGGGIYCTNYTSNTILSDTAVVKNNSAGSYGGGVYVAGVQTDFKMDDDGGKLYGNTAPLGNDAYILYNASYRNSNLYLSKASEMFKDGDGFTATGWLEEVSGAVYTDPVKIKPLGRSYAYTLRYRRSGKVVAVYNGEEYYSVQEAVDAIQNSSDSSGTIIMVDDSTESVTVGSGANITLNLNGHTLKGSGISAITSRGELEIIDEKKDVTAGSNSYTAGTDTGKITGTAAKAGGGILVLSGKVTLKSGMISECLAGSGSTDVTYGGAAVAVSSGEFVLDGGIICDNTAYHGAAVLVQTLAAKFTMYSGLIENNHTSKSVDSTTTGQGAIFNNGGKVNILGGNISGNEASYGAAVYNSGGTTIIAGNDENSKPVISGNTAGYRGGAIYLNTGTVITSNTIITGNKTTMAKSPTLTTPDGLSQSSGGAIFVAGGSLNVCDGTVIKGNKAVRGGAIYQRNGTVNISGSNTVITGNIAQLGGGCAQNPLPGNTTTTMTVSDGASVYANKSTLTIAGNDFYSAWEGTNSYNNQLGNSAQNTPRLNLLSASTMSVGDVYNVWKNDAYSGNQRTGKDLVSGQYITAEVNLAKDVQITAAYYETDVSTNIDSNYRVEALSISEVTDGTAEFDAGQTVSSQKYDDALPYEKTAKQALEEGLPGVSQSSETYMYNGKVYNYIEYNGKKYEQTQAVEWWPGNDSGGNNNIVRSYDKLFYTLLISHASTVVKLEDRDYHVQLNIKAVLPCSAEEATFVDLEGNGLVNATVTPSTDENGNPIQILTGYWNNTISFANAASGSIKENLNIYVYGMKNGDVLKPTFECWFGGNDTDPHAECASNSITVSAAPKYNVTILNNSELTYTSYFDTKYGVETTSSSVGSDDVVYGVMLGYGVTVELYNEPSTKSRKGIEIPADGLEFDISFKGKLFDSGGNEVADAVDAPTVWAYKENNTSYFGRAIGSNVDMVNMNWDDEDADTKRSYYAYGAAPYNTGNNSDSCYDGGGWTISKSADQTGSNESKLHVKIDGYNFIGDNDTDPNNNIVPNQYAGGVTSNILNSKAVEAFSAGYIQVILPLNDLDADKLSNGYYQIYMDSVVSGLDAKGISGLAYEDVLGEYPYECGLSDSEKETDLQAMNTYYSYPDTDTLKTNRLAVNETRYADNYESVERGLLVLNGSGSGGNSMSKNNLFNDESNVHINGSTVATDTGRGETPLNSTVFIEGNANFGSQVINTSDTNAGVHYYKNEQNYDTQLFNIIEYNYMTAINILQKFDADAFTPVGTEPVINQRSGTQAFTNLLNGSFSLSLNGGTPSWLDSAAKNYTLTILYAAKLDGTNWEKVSTTDTSVTPNVTYDDGGTADMDKYREENLIYFESLDDLHAYLGDDAKCVAILYQVRNFCMRSGYNVTARAKMTVTGDFDKVGKTYCTTNDVREWITYRPYYKMYYYENSLDQNIYTFNWHDIDYYEKDRGEDSEEKVKAYGAVLASGSGYESLNYYTQDGKFDVDLAGYSKDYVKTRYQNGTKVQGTHVGGNSDKRSPMFDGNTLLLYSLDTSININVDTKVEGSNTVKENYNITFGERNVRYRVTPMAKIASGANKNELVRNGTQSADITVTLILPKGLNYQDGSMSIDYSKSGYSEGELSWNTEIVNNDDGTTTVNITTVVSDIDKEIPEIYFDCTIGDAEDPNNDIKVNGTSLSVIAEIHAQYSENSIIAAETHTDSANITVSLTAQEGIAKGVENTLVEIGEDMTYTLTYGNNIKSSIAEGIEFVDVMPHNNDDRGTQYSGNYRIKSVELSFTSERDYNTFKNQSGKLMFGKDLLHWDSKVRVSDDIRKGFIESIIANNITVGYTPDDSNRKLTYDFSDKNLIPGIISDSNGNNVEAAPALYVYVPSINGEQRFTVKVTVTPLDNSGDLLERDELDRDGKTKIKKTQIGGNEYHNSFFYRSVKNNKPIEPLNSNEVGISVINRVISGVVWMDQDCDGMYNTAEAVETNNSNEDNDKKVQEYPLSGITATLYKFTNENTLEKAYNILGRKVEPVKTDKNGKYSFDNLREGDYIVVFTDEKNEYRYQHNPNDENDTIQPIAFDKLSVTTDSNRQAVRGSKCSAEYDTEDDLKLLDGKLYTFITMPSKAQIPTVLYSSPNWNLGLYYTDLTIEKQWENMVYGVPDNTEIKFEVVGMGKTQENEDKEVYKATLTMLNQEDKVTGSYVVETPSGTGEVSKNIEVISNPETNLYNWNLSDNNRLYLQARNAYGDIDYSVEETQIRIIGENGKDVTDFYNRYSQNIVDDVTKKRTYSAVNSQIMGSVTIVKKTGGGDALEDAEFSIYQITDTTKEEEKFYGAQEGISYPEPECLPKYYGKSSYGEQIKTKKYYKVILGDEDNLKALTKAGIYNENTNKLSAKNSDGTIVEYQVHKEKIYEEQTNEEQTRFYYYTTDTTQFEYELIIGGEEDYNNAVNNSVIDKNDKFENNGVKYSVLNRIKNGAKEYYVKISVKPEDFSKVAIVEFVNLPFFNDEGKPVYYTVRETGVPKGFLALADFNQLTELDLFNGGINKDHDFCFEVENTRQMELPVTGGSGMSTTVIIGMIIFTPCLTYIVWLVIMRRKKKGD